MKRLKITHALYSGLGGHGNVFFSFADANKEDFYLNALFYGIEPVRDEYVQNCSEKKIPFKYIQKKRGSYFSFYIRAFKALKSSSPDILLLHGPMLIWPAFIYTLFSKTKIIVRETQANHLKTIPDWILLISSFLFANKIVFLSTEYKEEVQKKIGFLYRIQKATVIPNGINLNDFLNIKSEKNGHHINIGMQSRVIPIKDHKTLLLAVSLLKNHNYYSKILLHIAGDGESLEKLRELALTLNIADKVIFYGVLDKNKLVLFLKSLDIYVHATLGETMSTAIMQAQACCLPIIASDVSGVNNVIINNKNGLLVMAENAAELSTAIDRLISDEELREKFAKESVNYALKNLSHETMFLEYKELIYSLQQSTIQK